MSLVTVLARLRSGPRSAEADPDLWAAWRWLATPDERVLGAIVAGAALLAVWGLWVGWRRGARGQEPGGGES